MLPLTVVIEDWEGDGGIRLPDEVLQVTPPSIALCCSI